MTALIPCHFEILDNEPGILAASSSVAVQRWCVFLYPLSETWTDVLSPFITESGSPADGRDHVEG